MVKTKTQSVDDKYRPVHLNTESNLVGVMRKPDFKGGNQISSKMTKQYFDLLYLSTKHFGCRIILLHFVNFFFTLWVGIRYYISHPFFSTSRAPCAVTIRENLLLSFVQVLHFAISLLHYA